MQNGVHVVVGNSAAPQAPYIGPVHPLVETGTHGTSTSVLFWVFKNTTQSRLARVVHRRITGYRASRSFRATLCNCLHPSIHPSTHSSISNRSPRIAVSVAHFVALESIHTERTHARHPPEHRTNDIQLVYGLVFGAKHKPPPDITLRQCKWFSIRRISPRAGTMCRFKRAARLERKKF